MGGVCGVEEWSGEARGSRPDRRELLEAPEVRGAARREDDEGEGWGGGHGVFRKDRLRTTDQVVRRGDEERSQFLYTTARLGVTCSAISRPAPISARRSSHVFWMFNQSCGVVPK